MNKIYSFFAALLVATSALAYDFTSPDINGNTIYYSILGGDSVGVDNMGSNYYSYHAYSGNVVIPATVENEIVTYRVTSVEKNAFYNCDISSVVFPNTITRIKNSAFFGCGKLEAINLPNSVKYIGRYAFSNCSQITSLIIPNGVDTIEEYAFFSCKKLADLEVSESVRAIGQSVFASCGGLTSISVAHGNVTFDSRNNCNAIIETATNSMIVACKNTVIPPTITGIEQGAFSGCQDIVTIEIPDGVVNIGSAAFSYCTGLNTINIPNSVKNIGEGAFAFCSGLIVIELPDNLISIGNSAFYSCSNLTSIVIPGKVEYIGAEAFASCNSLQAVTMSNKVTELGNNVFDHCSSLTNVKLSNNIKKMGREVFMGCDNLPVIDNIRYADTYLVEAVNTEQSEYVIPQGIRYIGTRAFQYCYFATIEIPNSVINIGNEAFYLPLTSVHCAATIPPTICDTSFYNIDSLYVPFESVEAYENSNWASFFYHIVGRAYETVVTDITTNSAVLHWIPDTAVTEYTVSIYTSDTLFAEYKLDGEGHVTDTILAPAAVIAKLPQNLNMTLDSEETFTISIDGLDPDTEYTYSVTGTNAEQQQIYHEEGAFRTQEVNTERFFDAIISESDIPRKIIRNGQILIQRGDKTYTVTGKGVQ